jgi:hypothetical protein
VLKAVLQEPAMCEGLPAQQAIPHSCDDARELKGTTPASTTSTNIVARIMLAIEVRCGLSGRVTRNKGKLRLGARLNE